MPLVIFFFFRNLALFTPRTLTLPTALTLLTVLAIHMLQYVLQLKTILITRITYITLTIQYLTHEHSFYSRTRGKKCLSLCSDLRTYEKRKEFLTWHYSGKGSLKQFTEIEAFSYTSSSIHLFVTVSSSLSFYCYSVHSCWMSPKSLNDLEPTFEGITGSS